MSRTRDELGPRAHADGASRMGEVERGGCVTLDPFEPCHWFA